MKDFILGVSIALNLVTIPLIAIYVYKKYYGINDFKNDEIVDRKTAADFLR